MQIIAYFVCKLVFWNYVYNIPWSFPHQNTSESYMLCKVFSLDRVYGSIYWFVNYSLNVGSVPWPKAHLGWGGAGHFCWKYKFVWLCRESLRYDWSRPLLCSLCPLPFMKLSGSTQMAIHLCKCRDIVMINPGPVSNLK